MPLVTTPINQPLQFRPLGPGGRGWSVGAMGFQVRLRSLLGGALRLQDCAGAVYSELLYAVTKVMCCRGPRQRELLPVLSGADACGRCKRRPFPLIHNVAGDRDHSGFIRKTLNSVYECFADYLISVCCFLRLSLCGFLWIKGRRRGFARAAGA